MLPFSAQNKVVKTAKNSAKKRSASSSVADKAKTIAALQASKKVDRKPLRPVAEHKRVVVDRSSVAPKKEEAKGTLTLKTRKDDVLPSELSEVASECPDSVDLTQPIAVDYEYEDLDTVDLGDPVMSAEYVVEIFNYLRILEDQTMPKLDYMETVQEEVTWKMRGILVDWLIDVHNKFSLLPETLFLAINVMDRFLSVDSISLPKLQLLGLTCLFIASKYEEVTHPSIKNFIYMTDNGYNEEEVLKVCYFLFAAR